MGIDEFMQGYKRVWEGRNPPGFAALFTPDGQYHNTPFQTQTGPDQLIAYWERILLQQDISLNYKVLSGEGDAGLAHWHVIYQVASEELFRIWAASTGTGLPDRRPGDPLPRMQLDGILHARFAPSGLAQNVRIWWHSAVQEPASAGSAG
jgi:SnoaL-like domain